jgi:hypothetical protein
MDDTASRRRIRREKRARLLDHQRVGRMSEAKSANRLHAADYAFG